MEGRLCSLITTLRRIAGSLALVSRNRCSAATSVLSAELRVRRKESTSVLVRGRSSVGLVSVGLLELALVGRAAVGRRRTLIPGVLGYVRCSIARVGWVGRRRGRLVWVGPSRFRLSGAYSAGGVVVVVQIAIRSRGLVVTGRAEKSANSTHVSCFFALSHFSRVV